VHLSRPVGAVLCGAVVEQVPAGEHREHPGRRGVGLHGVDDQLLQRLPRCGQDLDAEGEVAGEFKVFEGATEFRTVVAQRFVAHNVAAGRKGAAVIAEDVRARIRTEVGTELFGKEYSRPPADERELSGFIARGSRQATTAVAGYDLTFSPVKSVSTLWAVSPREVSQQIEAAHLAAIRDVVGWLEANAAYTRVGANGVRQVDTEGLIGAVFTHRDSRAGDPDLHTHVAISNKVQTRGTDGVLRWLALDGRVIHKAAVAASERYNTRLEAHLIDRLGVTFAERAATDPNKSRQPAPSGRVVSTSRGGGSWSEAEHVRGDRERLPSCRPGAAEPARPPVWRHRGSIRRPLAT